MSYRTVVKLTALIVKKEGISDEEFQRNFVEHGKKAVPKMVKHGLIEYKQNLCTKAMREQMAPGLESRPQQLGQEYDGIAELVFVDWKSARAWGADEEGKEAFANDVEFRDQARTQMYASEVVVFIEQGKPAF